MNTAMLLEELIRTASGNAPEPEEIKSILREAASMLSTEEVTDKVDGLLKDLKSIKFLPVADRVPPAAISLSLPRDLFLIVDDRRFGDAFCGKIRLLDFAANELSMMRPLFAALRLEASYLSRHVHIETTVENPTVDSKLTVDMRKRSFAISWSVHLYGSAGYTSAI